MTQVNLANERLKRRYMRQMREARGLAPSTIDQALRALAEYERFTSGRDFGKFRASDAEAFKKRLLANGGKRSVELANRSTLRATLQALQRFFLWLGDQDGFRTRVRFSDVEFFNLSNRDAQIARDRPAKPAPSLEQVQHAIRSMPHSTDVEKRDRALVACILLTGARVRAVTTLKLKHVRADRLGIDQRAEEVRTKFSRSYTTLFFPVGDDIREIFFDYVDHLRHELKLNGEDPLLPCTEQAVGAECYFHTTGLSRRHWATADPVRDTFRKAFAAGGLPYYSPHTIRRTLTLLGQRLCRTPEEMKAWSQNLAHKDMLTTFTNYGEVPMPRQTEIMTSFRRGGGDLAAAFEAFISLRGVPASRR